MFVRKAQLAPVVPVQAAVLHRFRQVLGGDALLAVQVGDGAGDFEDAVVGAGAQAQPADGHFQRALAGLVEGAELAEKPGRDVGVVEAALVLEGVGTLDTPAHFGGGNAFARAAQLLVGDGRHFDVEVDAVEQGAAELAEIALDDGPGAAAFAGGVAIEAARAPVQVTTATWT